MQYIKKHEALGSNLGETLKPQEFKQSRKTQREQREGERKGPGRENRVWRVFDLKKRHVR